MRVFFSALLLMLFMFVSPFLILGYFSRHSGISAQSVKGTLVQANVYNRLYAEGIASFEKTAKNDSDEQSLAFLVPYIKEEIPVSYLQKKTETLVDDMADWLTNKSTTPPVLSFSDIKQSLVTKHADVIRQLRDMQVEIRKQQQEAIQQAKASGETIDVQQMPDFDIDSFLRNDLTIPVGTYLQNVKSMYQVIMNGFIAVSVLLAVTIGIIFAIQHTMSARFFWGGIVFLFSAIWNSCIFLFVGVLPGIIHQSLLTKPFYLGDVVIPLVQTLVETTIQRYSTYQLYGSGLFMAASVIFFLLSGIAGRHTSIPVVQTPSIAAPSVKKKSKR